MNSKRWAMGGALGLALVVASVGLAAAAAGGSAAPWARGDDDVAGQGLRDPETSSVDAAEDAEEGGDHPISDLAVLERASSAALAWLSERGMSGTVTASEEGDEESRYEIEVTLDDGRELDIQLDDEMRVLGTD